MCGSEANMDPRAPMLEKTNNQKKILSTTLANICHSREYNSLLSVVSVSLSLLLSLLLSPVSVSLLSLLSLLLLSLLLSWSVCCRCCCRCCCRRSVCRCCRCCRYCCCCRCCRCCCRWLVCRRCCRCYCRRSVCCRCCCRCCCRGQCVGGVLRRRGARSATVGDDGRTAPSRRGRVTTTTVLSYNDARRAVLLIQFTQDRQTVEIQRVTVVPDPR